ncbi:MAG: hydantoinase/oxoprolinase N-terminal domain-containing protein, partial [Pyrobaculum sp.]
MGLVGVDVGGTFTDFVFLDEGGEIKTLKILSTPREPEKAVIEG